MTVRKFSLLRQLVWAATLATGFGTLWFVVVIWLTTSIDEAWRGGRQNWPTREEFVVRSDGTPLIRSTPWENYSNATYRDLNGGTQAVPDREKLVPAVYMAGNHRAPDMWSGHPTWPQRLNVFVNEREPSVTWFFVHDGKPEGAGYFVGYERESNRRVGFIGMAGAHQDPVPINERIPVRGLLMTDHSRWSSAPLTIYWSRNTDTDFKLGPSDLPPRLVYVPSGNDLREVDLAARTIRTVFQAPVPIESPGIPALEFWSGGRPVKDHPILVTTGQQIYALDRRYKIIRKFAIPTEIDRQSAVSWYEIGNGQAIAEFVIPWSTGGPDNVTKRTVYRVGADGAVQDRFELTLHTGSPRTNPALVQMQVLLGLPSPAFLVVVESVFLMRIDQIRSYPTAIVALFRTLGPSILAVVVLASVLAILTWRRSRSFGLPKREQIAWVIFVVLFGLPAFVGFLLCRRWPIRQPCTVCQAPAPRDRPACTDCGTRFPEPSGKGIEIFA